MSDSIEDDTAGTLQFRQEFERRYGPVHPNFFVGTFEEAVSEAFVPKEVCFYRNKNKIKQKNIKKRF